MKRLTAPAKEQAIAAIRDLEPAMRRHGILSACLFGSVARGDDEDESDIDMAVGMDEDGPFGYFDMRRAANLVAQRTGREVDVTTLPLRGLLRECAEEDLVRVF